MPEGLPEAAYAIIHGRFTDDQRKGVFRAGDRGRTGLVHPGQAPCLYRA